MSGTIRAHTVPATTRTSTVVTTPIATEIDELDTKLSEPRCGCVPAISLPGRPQRLQNVRCRCGVRMAQPHDEHVRLQGEGSRLHLLVGRNHDDLQRHMIDV